MYHLERKTSRSVFGEILKDSRRWGIWAPRLTRLRCSALTAFQASKSRRIISGVSCARHAVAAKIASAIVDKGVDGQTLAKSVAERPEQFGELRGRAGVFGENKERRAARRSAHALSNHVAAAARTWSRRLKAERDAEIWQREKRDIVEVPGITQDSERILKQFDGLSHAQKPQFLEALARDPEGRRALEEAGRIAHALQQRFGSSDPRSFKEKLDRLGLADVAQIERINDIARLVDRAQHVELSRRYELTRALTKGAGLRM